MTFLSFSFLLILKNPQILKNTWLISLMMMMLAFLIPKYYCFFIISNFCTKTSSPRTYLSEFHSCFLFFQPLTFLSNSLTFFLSFERIKRNLFSLNLNLLVWISLLLPFLSFFHEERDSQRLRLRLRIPSPGKASSLFQSPIKV